MGIGDWFSRKERVVVFHAGAHEVMDTPCVVNRDSRLIRSSDGSKSWPIPPFDAVPLGKARAYYAIGATIVPWPTKEKPAWDVMDDGTKLEITPEHIDHIAEHAYNLGTIAAAGEMSWTDRLMHMGAGAAIGLVLGFILIKYLGFSIVHGNGDTVVTITNTTNATAPGARLAHAGLFAFGPIHDRGVRWMDTRRGKMIIDAFASALALCGGILIALILAMVASAQASLGHVTTTAMLGLMALVELAVGLAFAWLFGSDFLFVRAQKEASA